MTARKREVERKKKQMNLYRINPENLTNAGTLLAQGDMVTNIVYCVLAGRDNPLELISFDTIWNQTQLCSREVKAGLAKLVIVGIVTMEVHLSPEDQAELVLAEMASEGSL